MLSSSAELTTEPLPDQDLGERCAGR